MEQIQDKKITHDQVNDLTSELELDLISYFKILEADILDIINNNDDPQEIIKQIDNLFQ